MKLRLPLRAKHALHGAVLAAAALAGCARSEAQEAPSTLFVSGISVGGSARAVVRFTNVAPASNGVFRIHYTVRTTGAGKPLSLPAAGPSGVPLVAGRTVELDLGAAVNAYRRSIGFGPYTGRVQFVAYGEGGSDAAFGPDTVAVQAVQTVAGTSFEPVVAWR